jgi:methyl-accepting chemotaxis protein
MESSGAMVMVADAEHRIHFLSRALSDHFLKSEQEIRKSLPDFRADQVIGSTIDAFHQDMQEQRAMLDKLEHRHHAKIALGRARFDVMFSPVFSKSGTRVGSVVEWADVTEQLAMQQDIDGVIRGAIAGDFTQRVEAKAEGAILTRMGNNVNTLLGAFEDGISSLQSTIGQMAEGDLAVRMDGEYQGAFEILQTDLNRTVARLEELVSDIQITSQEINSNTVTIAEDARSLSQRTESQAASLEETAATMEEMSSTIRNNAENAQTATGLAATTEHRADEGGAVVRDAVTAMARIEESSEKMSQIIAVIDSIAFQTNLLALNAAVEAARAGDAGKGFAVVASEVRTLAQRSGEAAKDIKELIQFSSTHVTEGVALVHKTGDALGAIIDSIGKVNSAITDITAMSKEQATGVDEISSALSEMDGMTQKNAAMAEQSASRAGLLADKANALTELVRFFRTGKETAKSTFPEESSVPKAPKPTLSRETDPVLRLPYDGNAALDPSWKEF